LKDRIYMDKLSKLELHIPEESFDKALVVDNTPVIEQTNSIPSIALPNIPDTHGNR